MEQLQVLAFRARWVKFLALCLFVYVLELASEAKLAADSDSISESVETRAVMLPAQRLSFVGTSSEDRLELCATRSTQSSWQIRVN